MRFLIVTGMSGGGKATAIRILEDAGYYCVDNLPVRLVEKFMELVQKPGGADKVVLGLDVRADKSFTYVEQVLSVLRKKGYRFEILFMDASDEVLLKRYKETRRAHPMEPDGRVEDGIARERVVLRQIRHDADYIYDTSHLLVRDLREELLKVFAGGEQYRPLMVSVLSFGFKNGIPSDADLVFDVRFLPNPYYDEKLRDLTGLDEQVRSYALDNDTAKEFLTKLEDLIRFLLPNYIREGKNQLVIAFGCTGGHHRSVAAAQHIYEALQGAADWAIRIYHRDIPR